MIRQYIRENYMKIASGIGLTTVFSIIGYEAYKSNKILRNLINTRVLDVHRKGPEYIYIEHQIFRRSLKRDLAALEDYQPLAKPWKKFKNTVALKLLRMAQSGDHQQRLKAVQQLSLIEDLKDWDYNHLAQMCDARTAVALARSDCDIRWFLSPRNYGIKKTLFDIANEIRIILEPMLPHSCVEYALDNAFLFYQEKDPDGDISDGLRLTKHDSIVIQQILDALLHLTTLKEFVESFIEKRGLEILVDLEKLEENDVNMRLTLCRIMANITEFGDLAYDFFATGWLKNLAKWVKDEDMRVQVTAFLALANLDKDDDFNIVYPTKVYPLYPKSERKFQPNVDVIFIHGLLGGVFITWRQKKSMVPEASSLTNTKSNTIVPKVVKKSSLFPNLLPIMEKKVEASKEIPIDEGTLKPMKIEEESQPNIADTQTQEIIKALKEDEGLGNDWEVVFHDVPTKEINANGTYSVPGSEWFNEESRDEYTYCWPMEWIPQDFPNSRIIGLSYDSSLTQWYGTHCPCLKTAGKLDPRSRDFLEKIKKAGVGKHPIVWIGHSMGGLLIKSMLVHASHSTDPSTQQIAQNTKGIIFLGTPHKGSPVAKLKGTEAIIWPSLEVQDLKEGAPHLIKLDNDFMKLLQSLAPKKIEIACLCEGRPTMMTSFKVPFTIVLEDSAKLEGSEFYMTPDDHLGLSKPMCRQSFLYQRLSKMIENATKVERVLEDEAKEDIQRYHRLFSF